MVEVWSRVFRKTTTGKMMVTEHILGAPRKTHRGGLCNAAHGGRTTSAAPSEGVVPAPAAMGRRVREMVDHTRGEGFCRRGTFRQRGEIV